MNTDRKVAGIRYAIGALCALVLWAARPAPALAQTATLTVEVTGSGSVTSVPAGIDCPGDCSEPYVLTTPVTLTATAVAGESFVGWTNCAVPTGDTCAIVIAGDLTVGATFTQPFDLNVSVTGSGTVTSTPSGITCTNAGGAGCTASFASGTLVTLNQSAGADFVFGSWGGDCGGTGTCSVTMTAPHSVTATFLQLFTLTVNKTGSGTVTSSPAGISCGTGCTTDTGDFADGTSVTLTATAVSGWTFTGWSGACAGTGSCIVTMSGDQTVTATFTQQTFNLTVSVTGSGTVTSTPSGITCTSAGGAGCTASFASGTVVSLNQSASANWAFSAWGGDCTGSGSCSVTMNAAHSVTATFNPRLSVSVTGSGTVTSTPSGITCTSAGGAGCTASFASGTLVTLSQSAGADFVFGSWGGDCGGTGTCSVTMTAPHSVTATFLQLFTLTLNKNAAVGGTVTSSPAGIICGTGCTTDTGDYADGTSVTLTATAASGWTFTGWSGACAGTGPCDVAMTADRTVTATFTQQTFNLTVSVTGSGTVTSTPSGITCTSAGGAGCTASFASGTVVSLNQSASANWAFSAWGGDCSGSGSCSVTMNAAHSVTATFNPRLSVSVTGSGTVTSTPSGITCTSAGGAGCTASFASGTLVTLSQSAGADFVFGSWGGDCSGSGPCSVTMNAPHSVSATFLQLFTLTLNKNAAVGGTVTSSPAGISCGTSCTTDTGDYADGTSVTLTASVASGWTFSGWTGCTTSSGTSCTVTMTGDRTVTANFTQTFNLTVSVTGSGTVTSSPAGINCTSSGGAGCTASFTSGTLVTLNQNAGTGFVFETWGGACSGSGSCSVTMNASQSVSALFLELFTLTVNKSAAAAGTVTSSPAGISCGTGCTTDTGDFKDGTLVTLTATPATGWVFDSWTGCTSTTDSCSFTMTADRTVTANFTELVDLTVARNPTSGGSVSGPGITCGPTGTDCAETYESGTEVTLTAAPAAGWGFDSWTNCTSTTETCTFTITADRTVTANFSRRFTLTVAKDPAAGGTVTSGDGKINCGTDCTETYKEGTSVTLTAAPAPNFVFAGWTGCTSATNTCTFTMTANLTVTAHFTQLFTLTVTVNGNGTVTSSPAGINCGADCTEPYEDGTDVTLTAAAAIGWQFTGWTGACTGTGPCVVDMTANRSVSATFTQLFTLTVTVSGQGTVTSSPAGINCTSSGGAGCSATYLSGTNVTLTPSPAADWVFTTWGGSCGGSGPCVVAMTTNRSVSASFLQLFTLTVDKTGSGTVTSNPAGINCGTGCTTTSAEYANGTIVTLTATPAAGWAFTGWIGACTGTAACVVTLSADRTVSATFKPVLTVDVNGDGTVTSSDGKINCGTDCTEIYDFGTQVTLTATPAAGEVFHDWNGCDSTSGTTCTITMTQGHSVTANFVPTRRLTVTVTTSGLGVAGTVTSSPAGIACPGDCEQDYQLGQMVTLTAQPGEFTTFTGWTGCQSSSGTTCTVNMSETRSVTADFVAFLTITETGLRGGLLGASYADTVQVSGGAETKTWSLVGGSLPPGLTLAPATGVVSGTAGALGNYTFTLRVESPPFDPAQKALSIRISEPQDVSMSAVVDQLLLGASSLTPDQLNYLDLIGNANGRFDVGDFRAFLMNGGGSAASRAADSKEP